jgi:hypothetical protein
MAESRRRAGSSALNAIAQFNAAVVDSTLGLSDLGAQGVAGISNMITGRNDRPVMLSRRAKSALNVESDPSSPSYIAGLIAPAVATGVGTMARQGASSIRNFFGNTLAELGGYFGGEAGAQIGREYGGDYGEMAGSLVGGMAAPSAPRSEIIAAGHASPHEFERFSMDKIGTGEGAQVFGHGLYFAENPRVVDEYYKNFNMPVLRFKERNLDTPYTSDLRDRFKDVYESLIDYDAARKWRENLLDRAYDADLNEDEIIENLNVLFRKVFEGTETPTDFDAIDFDKLGIDPNDIYDIAGQQSTLDNVLGDLSQARTMEELEYVLEGFSPVEMRLYRDLVEPELSEIRDSASRYDVNLNVEPDELLDWDAPYSKQPEKVKKLLDDVLTLNGVESYIPKDTGSKVYLGVADSADLRGSDIYRIITDQLGRMPDSASRELSASGVKGIKYLDGMSRSGQEGTRNYVIFDDSLIDTKRVNDKLTPSWMDQGARMQRAQDLGYDTSRPLYHYTDKLENETELSSLQPSPENVQTKLGRGIYTSPNPQYGDRYVRQGRDLSEGYNENARAIPVYARGKLATGDEYEAAYKAATDSLGIQRGVVDQQTKLKIRSDIQNKAQEILKEQGFDGVQFMDEVMIFDPKNVRSINAEFDPTRADSADLLSSRQSERQMSALRGIA